MAGLRKLQDFVRNEIEHIPRSPSPQQGELRIEYWRTRLHHSGKKGDKNKTPKDALEEAIARLREYYPDFEFKYDVKFFRQVEQK